MKGALLSVTTIEKERNKGTPATRQKGGSHYYAHVTVFTNVGNHPVWVAVAWVEAAALKKLRGKEPPEQEPSSNYSNLPLYYKEVAD